MLDVQCEASGISRAQTLACWPLPSRVAAARRAPLASGHPVPLRWFLFALRHMMAHVCRESPKAAVAIAAMGFSLSVVAARAGVGVAGPEQHSVIHPRGRTITRGWIGRDIYATH